MRVLTFNWHEAYLCMLARTGHAFDIVERMKGGSRAWFYETRPLPANARIVKESTARRELRSSAYDAIVCHNLGDLIWALEYPILKVLVLHNRLTTEVALAGPPATREAQRSNLLQAIGDTTAPLRIVFISESKRADWGLDGDVIPPGIDLDEYSGYVGDDATVLRVGNFMKRRDIMLGYTAQQAILGILPSTMLGLNPPEPGARFTTSWDDLKTCFRTHRVFLNTTVEGYEDGYNLAMLEAMATGMPIVSTANSTSPIVDGVNGYVSADLSELSERIHRLLRDRTLAGRLGERARATVAESFPLETFVARWERVLAGARPKPRATRTRHAPIAAPTSLERESTCVEHDGRRPPRVLLAYVSYPATTARYLERSLRRTCDVRTVGPAMTPELVRAWNLENMKAPIVPHDLPCGATIDMDRVVRALPRGWRPDLFLWVESVHGYFPRGIGSLECPTACYLIDSHLNLGWHVRWAPRFDWVFTAQRHDHQAFRDAGCERVHWLPLACDPEIHGGVDVPKRHDIGFVGSLTPHHATRKARLARLSARFSVHVERSFFREMAETLSASRLVFNDAVKNDLNMRVFEALATGSLLLTDRPAGSGLEELFVDREHLVVFEDRDLEDLAAYYLAHDEEREAIAARGRREVLRWHTYDHRVAALLDTIFGEQRLEAGETMGRIEDALLQDAARLLTGHRFADALARLDLAARGRELTPVERFALHGRRAQCLAELGREDEARDARTAAMAALPPNARRRALDVLACR